MGLRLVRAAALIQVLIKRSLGAALISAPSRRACAGVGGLLGHLLGLWWVRGKPWLLHMRLINPAGLVFRMSPSSPAAWEIATGGQRGGLIDSLLTFIWTSHMPLDKM